MRKEDLQGTTMGRGWGVLGFGLIVVALSACGIPAWGQNNEAVAETQSAPSDFVTINVDDGSLTQVLTAFSRQTGRSMVVGPEVTGKVTVRLKQVRWDEALNTILKPSGFGYYSMGETIVVCSQDKLPEKGPAQATASAGQTNGVPSPPPEPSVTRVFTLKYLDAGDVEEMIKAQLSPAGKVSKLVIRSQSWKADAGAWGTSGGTGGSGSSGSSAEGMGRLRRVAEESDLVKGKTIVVSDTASVIARVAAVLAEVDKMPIQVLIEAKFIEVESDLLRDLGVEFGTGANGAESPGVQTVRRSSGKSLYGLGAQQISGTAKPGNFGPEGSLSASRPFDAGLSVAFQQLTGVQLEALLHLLQEDASFNILSSPRILTLNNQDATIIVGTKFPIINSQSTASGGTAPTISTSLEYYENVGIQLKVLPQICDEKFVNLIIHPSVRELVGTSSGKVGTGTGTAGAGISLTEYPVLSTREAETQVMVESGRTIVIGGLIKDRKTTSTFKVPFLGSIPLLGALFRRDTVDNQKIDLLIFLTATIRSPAQAAPTVEEKKLAEGTPAAVGAKKKPQDSPPAARSGGEAKLLAESGPAAVAAKKKSGDSAPAAPPGAAAKPAAGKGAGVVAPGNKPGPDAGAPRVVTNTPPATARTP